MRQTITATLSALATCFTMASPAVADGPTVIELYTSQGCSSCPPADEILHELAGQSDVIALALHVDYWDYIGWADIFADPAHTRRQQNYARVAGASSIYTPQMVIGGADHVIGTKPMDVANLIRTHSARPTGTRISLQRSGNQLQISGQTARALRNGTVVQVIRYSPEETVDVRRGENAGRTLTYSNIVTQWSEVGEWSGSGDLNMNVRISGNSPVVVIVQEPGPGAVMASAVLR
ncbi:DUF1223 domain-containing protein [Octadecabacter ascidiaceicola]|uniref:DUF1223 domain-containing protein n=1 Tax=Octadecabacter ascidiaceicola TaxID=1655543 RepID=A0A238JP54_9RHOB|nr:DUF1223 domain-containing protein [Octadecabacter ascidiaceicola]SMX32285.1 hypothetical protein OCA8868_00694 [Octadecabacter ascidiaceicola]